MKLVLTLGLLLGTLGCEDKPQRHPPNVPPLPSGSPSLPRASATPPAAMLIDINHASQAELEALPAVGEAYARRIIAGRPYAEKTQLRSRDIVPEGTYQRIRDLIIARQN
ncbi:MAG: helix-hairpin-helix domain-containing protein [Deltaproteobacteria bacterium]|nr:helix-hairpin-helix domain-containing protein [Deltaproteobacteria bacterium]